jgi:cytochrome c peroxidase
MILRSIFNRLLFLLVFIPACAQISDETQQSNEVKTTPYELEIPVGFAEPVLAEDNPLNQEKIALGQKLFFDPLLSKDSSISCASCHFTHKAFSDTVRFSIGVDDSLGIRNAPPLFNLAWNDAYMRDGGVPTLAMQVISPIQDEREMHNTVMDVIDRLNVHPEYPQLFQTAFNDSITPFTLTRAIEAFEWTLISGNAPFDRFEYQQEEKALSTSAQRGWELFKSDRLNCIQCHSEFNFTNNTYQCNGLYENYEDVGRARITHDSTDIGKFKVPSLRNLGFTAPYFHDGSAADLNEVIDHYAAGGKKHFNQSELIGGFELNEQERFDLIEFLCSLNDSSFVSNTKKLNPTNIEL